jgi:hypothetical protein
VEGAVGDLGAGPFLALDDFAPGVAVTADGVLRQGEAAGPTVGPALAALWPGVVAAPSAEPPGEDDAILIVATPGGAADGPRVLDALAVDGAVRALAGRPRGGSMRLVAALEDEQGGTRLLVMDLRHLQP